MAFEGGDDFTRFVVFPLSDEETGGVREERAERVNAEGEEYLEGQGESPSYGAFGEREA